MSNVNQTPYQSVENDFLREAMGFMSYTATAAMLRSIAKLVDISPKTVRSYGRILRKMADVLDRAAEWEAR